MPTVVTSLAEPHLLGTAMSITVSSWAPGYLVVSHMGCLMKRTSASSTANFKSCAGSANLSPPSSHEPDDIELFLPLPVPVVQFIHQLEARSE